MGVIRKKNGMSKGKENCSKFFGRSRGLIVLTSAGFLA